MTTPSSRAAAHDDRWGDHVPWSLRHSVAIERGNVRKFLDLLGIRFHTLFEHNELGHINYSHFFARLKSESFGRFQGKSGETYGNMAYYYFSPVTIDEEVKARGRDDPEEKACTRLLHGGDTNAYAAAAAIEQVTRQARHATHWQNLIADRLEVLQSSFVLLEQDKRHDALKSLVRDVRRIAAETGVLLDIKGNPPTIVPIEEPLLQKEVLDRLLPRLEAKHPARAMDLISAYHSLLKGVDTNTVFGNAFKALEELAREISGIPKLELSERPALEKAFPKLHGTIRETIIKLAAHRGDEGAHGRKGPDEYEMRYLLLAICNVALVLLEYNEHCG